MDPRVSALKIDREAENDSSDGENDDDDLAIKDEDPYNDRNIQAVRELPQKVDMFSQYVNDMYFAGDIDATSEDYIKKGMAESNVNEGSVGKEKPKRKKAYCSD